MREIILWTYGGVFILWMLLVFFHEFLGGKIGAWYKKHEHTLGMIPACWMLGWFIIGVIYLVVAQIFNLPLI